MAKFPFDLAQPLMNTSLVGHIALQSDCMKGSLETLRLLCVPSVSLASTEPNTHHEEHSSWPFTLPHHLWLALGMGIWAGHEEEPVGLSCHWFLSGLESTARCWVTGLPYSSSEALPPAPKGSFSRFQKGLLTTKQICSQPHETPSEGSMLIIVAI